MFSPEDSKAHLFEDGKARICPKLSDAMQVELKGATIYLLTGLSNMMPAAI